MTNSLEGHSQGGGSEGAGGGGQDLRLAAVGVRVSPTPVGEITPGDPAVWEPRNFDEWVVRERTKTFLVAWVDQMGHERALRSLAAKVILGLIGCQVLAVFAIVLLQGLALIQLDNRLLQVLIPSVLGDVFGLGFVVTKYLFSQPLRHSLDALVKGGEITDAA